MTAFADYKVGDQVYCLAWIGKRFEITARDDARGVLSLQGELEGLPTGAQVDIFPHTTWMVTHAGWDQIWYWPDRAGESYREPYQRFVKAHKAGDIITAYQVEGPSPLTPAAKTAEGAMTLRILAVEDMGVLVQPVTGIDAEGRVVREADGGQHVRWEACGPASQAQVKMVGYRWCVAYGDVVLTWQDFFPQA